MKLCSLRVWPSVLGLVACVGLASATTGCIIVADDNDDDVVVVDNPRPVEPMLVTIDSDAILEAEGGEGVGVFVEYAAGGHWLVWTTCDTNYSGNVCAFDIFATVDTSSNLELVQGDGIEGYDFVNVEGSGGLEFYAETSADVDAVQFTTTPGAIVRLEVNIDGSPQPRFIYWVGNGVLHEGAPTSPIDFEPSVP
ncbi:hypothetical protein [Polyangium aurulentum]|uniref:hypothetical protein n=1 Tax=Polyangium aurulentum TaxID=2567896 RepID=UPI0010AEDE9A|nr:hypothetical protein [Polyangium aurulentum]UQA58857.1 hypothetical protein E8A73_047840 [Polyangium aurulentum]